MAGINFKNYSTVNPPSNALQNEPLATLATFFNLFSSN